jgi:hypothetical protein
MAVRLAMQPLVYFTFDRIHSSKCSHLPCWGPDSLRISFQDGRQMGTYRLRAAGGTGTVTQLICYPTSDEKPLIVSAPRERDWMDASHNRYAYRCLPLNIANTHGWFVLNNAPFVAVWNGEPALDAIKIEARGGNGTDLLATSHFGQGVMTFRVDGIFRTDPGFDLWVGGPTNIFKDGIQPLTGIVETDWTPFTFTMNWRFTRKDSPVSFEHREPICMIFPIERRTIEKIRPQYRSLEEDAELEEMYERWATSRREFNVNLMVEGSDARRQKWQKQYFRGETIGGPKMAMDHRTKMNLSEFE